jgi:hypothetical protein
MLQDCMLEEMLLELRAKITELLLANQLYLAALIKKMDEGERITIRIQGIEYELLKNQDDELEISINNIYLH